MLLHTNCKGTNNCFCYNITYYFFLFVSLLAEYAPFFKTFSEVAIILELIVTLIHGQSCWCKWFLVAFQYSLWSASLKAVSETGLQGGKLLMSVGFWVRSEPSLDWLPRKRPPSTTSHFPIAGGESCFGGFGLLPSTVRPTAKTQTDTPKMQSMWYSFSLTASRIKQPNS